MRITYLPEVANPTKTTVFFPVVTAGQTRVISLNSLNITGAIPGVSKINAGTNIALSPAEATSYAEISFDLPGTIWPWPRDEQSGPPSGWLFCFGQQNLSRVVYSRLFSVIGINYGSGDGRSTFGLPDLRGRVIQGLETMGGAISSGRITGSVSGNLASNLGAKGGTEFNTLNDSQVPSIPHTHTVSSVTGGYTGGTENGNRCSGGNGYPNGQFNGSGALGFNYSFTLSTQSATADPHPNIPPLAFFNWIIKY
ncbi:MAG: hypothetical protein EBU96_01170 [Actinobacteria bacterium]|nr:hypothetical protein [Actinomycetota bacterium]